jgi:Ca2+-dependent lipid-binding protein
MSVTSERIINIDKIGKLLIRVIEAKDTKSLDRNGLNDLYCRLYINEYQTIKTKVIYKSLNPVWNEEYVLYVCLAVERLKFFFVRSVPTL